MNTYFQFKQFKIDQAHCAMKVSEIACLLGAWATANTDAIHILDIGAGSGLLSLMIAQKNNQYLIDAVEIEETCYLQAKQNIENSIFQKQIHIFHTDINQFDNNQSYDFIISNPPFFENDLKTTNHAKNIAWHSSELTFASLIEHIHRLLKPTGSFALICPTHRTEELILLCEKYQYFLQKKLSIQHSTLHSITHYALSFSHIKNDCIEQQLIIKENNQYTNEFITLLKSYYLYL